jgi:hypothetical protein
VKRHAFDPISFVFGLLFAFLAVFVLSGSTLADLYPLWVWTLPAMAVGLLVVLYGARRLMAPASQVAEPGAEPAAPGMDEPVEEDLGGTPAGE